MAADACPSDQMLRAFQLGDLPEPDLGLVADHLETCPHCGDRAQHLDDHLDPILAAIREDSTHATRLPGPHPRLRAESSPTHLGSSSPANLGTDIPEPPRLRGYEILGLLGHGGMGVVYKARQVGLNRLVALKLILGGTRAGVEELTRFHNEAEAVARLQHPNLVQIYEIGRQEGQLFLSLEYVDGGTLRDHLDGKPQPPRPAAALIETLARAMHYAHQQGVIHRDLKPANILLVSGGVVSGEWSSSTPHHSPLTPHHSPLTPHHSPLTTHQVKVSDFGLAQQLNSDLRVTQTGNVAGTPTYMAPEQAEGKRELFGPTIDVYSLGVILYELLTGRVPFEGLTAIETMRLVLTQEPVAPRLLQPGLPTDLQTICLKCLEKEPRRRYASAAALAEDLRRFLDHKPITARPTATWERGWRWTRRQPAVAGLLAGIVLVAVLGLAGILVEWHRAVTERERAETNERTAVQARDEVIRERERKEAQRQAAVQARDEAEASLYFSRVLQGQLQWKLNHDVTGALALLDQCRPRPGETDRRGWEWHHLQALCHADQFTRRAHPSGYVNAVAFRPDGRLLASAGGGNPFYASQGPSTIRAGEIILWEGGQARQVLRGHEHLVVGVAFSPDGSRLASVGLDHRVILWEVETGAALQTLEAPEPRAVAFSPDGQRLLTGQNNGTVTLWNLTSGTAERTWPGHRSPVAAVAFSPDGKVLASGGKKGAEGDLILWDAATGKPLHQPVKEAVGSVAFSPDGKQLLAGGTTVSLWNVADGRLAQTFLGHGGMIHGVAFSPDGAQVATAGADKTLRLWDVRSGTQERIYRGHASRLRCLAFHPTGETLVSGDDHGTLKSWDLTRHPEHMILDGHSPSLRFAQALAFTAGDRDLQIIQQDGVFKVIDVATGRLRQEHPLDLTRRFLTPATLAAISGDGRLLATVSADDLHVVRLWDAATGKACGVIGGPDTPIEQHHGGTVSQIAFSADGRRLATSAILAGATPEREIKVWDTGDRRLLLETQVPGVAVARLYGGLALSADGRRLACDEYNVGDSSAPIRSARVTVWDVDHPSAERLTYPLPKSLLRCLAFSPDGRALAAGNEAGGVTLWDLAAGPPAPAVSLPCLAFQLAFGPDGKRLAAVNREEVKLWDVSTGQEILVLRGAAPPASDPGFNPQLAWSRDGRKLAAGLWDRTVAVWDAGERGPESAEAVEARAFAWHLTAAAKALVGKAPGTFAFHWSFVRDGEPPDPSLRRWRGLLHACREDWKSAAADYRRAVEGLPPEDPREWCVVACLESLAGDRGECRKACAALAKRANSDGPADELLQAARTLALIDPEGEESKALQDRVRKEADERRSALACHILGVAAYRAGRFEEARRWAERCRDLGEPGSLQPATFFLLALAQQHLGNPADARKTLTRAEERLGQLVGEEPNTTWVLLRIQPLDALLTLLLRDEARRDVRR